MNSSDDPGSQTTPKIPQTSVLTHNVEEQTDVLSSESRRHRICEALNNFSSRTSLNGLIFIQTSSDLKMKLFWSFVFTSAVFALVYHSYSTVFDYLEYKTKVDVEQVWEKSLQLPAVTICNHNHVRLSKIGLIPTELQQIILVQASKSDSMLNKSREVNDTVKRSEKLVENVYDSIERLIQSVVLSDRESFQKAGHQFEDMFLWCRIGNDEECGEIPVELMLSEDFNNCYTLDTSSLTQYTSGIYAGLEITLYLEPEEYVPVITDTKGIQLQIHSKKSYIYPAYDGISLSPGMMTLVAISQENVTRLGYPYSSCVDTDDYIDKYNFTYSSLLCYDICWLQQYVKNCGCYDSTWFNVVYNPNNVTVCERNYKCEKHDDLYNPDLCSCEQPCREVAYKSKISLAKWPSQYQGNMLVDYLCSKSDFPPERCDSLRNQSEAELSENFVGIRIYYESMYSTRLTDVAEINLATFLSNLGGSVGLWIGVSVFSIVELLHLFADVTWRVLSGLKLCNRSVRNGSIA